MAKADVMAGRAFVSLYMKQDAFTKGLRAAQQRMQKFGADMTAMGRQLVAISAAGVVPMALATKRFADFDDAMRMVKAVSRSTEQQFQQLTDTAKMLGATTSFTAVEVASLMTELGRAGFTADEINVMTAAVMNLARATGTDATISAGIMSASLRQFGLGATEAARVADVLTHAANATFNTVEGLGESLKYAGPVAASLGMSFEDTAAILGTLGNVGIQGSEAGTALRRLSVISAATGKELKEIFGISNVDAAGNLKPLVQIMGEIGTATEKLPVAERVSKMNDAFGLLGITAASVMAGTAVDTKKLADELRNAGGTAANAAKEMDSGLGGAFRIIMSAAEGVAIELGNAISEPLQKAVKFGSDFLSLMVKVIKNNKETVIWFSKIALAVGAVGASLVALGLSFSALSVIVGGFASAITFATAALGGIVAMLGAVLSPVGILVATLAAGMVYWARFTEAGQAAVAGLVGFVSTTFGGIAQTVTDTLGMIVEAISAGDLERAGQIAMTGLRLAFAQGLEAISGELAIWKEAVLETWDTVNGFWNGVVDGLVDGWFESIWAMEDFFLGFIDGITEASENFFRGFIDGINEVADKTGNFASGFVAGLTGGAIDAGTIESEPLGALPDIDIGAEQKARAQARADMRESLRQERQARDAGFVPRVAGQRAASPEVARLQAELAALKGKSAEKVQAMQAGTAGAGQSPDFAAGGMLGESSGGKASAASFNLMELNGAADGQMRAIMDTKKAIENQTKQQKDAHAELLAAVRSNGLYHA